MIIHLDSVVSAVAGGGRRAARGGAGAPGAVQSDTPCFCPCVTPEALLQTPSTALVLPPAFAPLSPLLGEQPQRNRTERVVATTLTR